MLAFCGVQDAICGEAHLEISYRIKTPSVESISLTPNPVNQNAAFIVSVVAAEIEIFLPPKFVYCGTFSSGQEAM
ncbi:hypothetical protein [Sporosarcina sp. FA9]|uniref:hypothetical protein n=1 Tax=Sporosarcina sp. FA9 TaxID=3413030 RepID=UPI003F65FCDA